MTSANKKTVAHGTSEKMTTCNRHACGGNIVVPVLSNCTPTVAAKVNESEVWLSRNKQLWSLFERGCLREVEARRKFGTQAIAERLRWLDLVDADGLPTSINNNNIAYLTRRFIFLHPEAKKYVTVRRSMFDSVEFSYVGTIH